jgi:Photosynthetic reaction centre cytochrome C subunit
VKRGVHAGRALRKSTFDLQYQPMLTRPLVTALVLVLAATAAPACKADRSKPRLGPPDASQPAGGGKSPIASGGGPAAAAVESKAGADAGAEPATGKPKTEPKEEPRTEPKGEPKEKPKGEPGTEPPPKPDDTEAKEDQERPTNLKVLPKSWSTARVQDFMKKQVTRGLGVKCGHCHVKGDYAADGNEHKKAARSMMQMTDGLNRQFFNGKPTLSCFTCHKGQEKPPGAK